MAVSTQAHPDRFEQRRLAIQALGAAPWWLPAIDAFARQQQTQKPLDERLRAAKVERGGLSLDIPTLAKTGTSVPVVLFVDPARLFGRTVARLGIIAPQNLRPVALEIELGPVLRSRD
jgi:predicted secreted protein